MFTQTANIELIHKPAERRATVLRNMSNPVHARAMIWRRRSGLSQTSHVLLRLACIFVAMLMHIPAVALVVMQDAHVFMRNNLAGGCCGGRGVVMRNRQGSVRKQSAASAVAVSHPSRPSVQSNRSCNACRVRCRRKPRSPYATQGWNAMQ